MIDAIPDLLTGTELCLIAQVPAAGDRWQQVHLNVDVARQFFNLKPGDQQSITLEKIGSSGELLNRSSRQLVFPESNRNSRIEFDFGAQLDYPVLHRPLIVVVEADYLVYRYRTLLPSDPGYEETSRLLMAGPSIGKGVHRRIVTLDDVEAHWPHAALRGATQ
jgi:hypothetical protein